MLGTDLILHAGILARAYATPSPFLLPPERAFALVPLGYLSFLILSGLLVWLTLRLDLRGVRSVGRFGLILGGTIWASLALGMASITTAAPSLLVGWFVGQTVEMGIAGLLVGAARAGVRPLRLWSLTTAWCLVAFVVVVALQTLGIAPVAEIR